MKIIDFYQELSDMLEQARDSSISKSNAQERLNQMIEELKQEGIEVDISPEIFDFQNLVKFDDERSYVEEESSYEEDEIDFESSYEDEE